MPELENTFIASYLFDTGDGLPEWEIKFYAKDMEEAQSRIKAMRETLKFDGELKLEINIPERID